MKSYLKSIISSAVALITSCNLFGCTFKQFDEERVSAEMEQIITQLFISVQHEDKEAFKTFFADHVVELPSFEAGCKYIFDVYHGDLVNVKFSTAGHTGKHIVQGEQICYAYMTFIITSTETEYEACVEFYTKYESRYPNDPYKIRQFSLFPKQSDGSFIPKESDGNFDSDWIAFGQRYGIYYPDWNKEETE